MPTEILGLGLFLLSPFTEVAIGNWNLTLKVGHRGEGLRTVVLEVEEEDGGYSGRLTSMQNRMVDADEVTFDGKTLTVVYGSYRYELEVAGDTAKGTVASPAGNAGGHGEAAVVAALRRRRASRLSKDVAGPDRDR